MKDVAALVDSTVSAFVTEFGSDPEGVWFAPGRVNLIGEHTDYNDGFVLPIALPLGTVVAVRRRQGGELRVHSAEAGETRSARLADVAPEQELGWLAYVAGVGWAAAQRGLEAPGLDISLAANLPQGAGLSSSASLSCGTATAWSDLAGWELSGDDIAALGRTAENEIAGAPTGVMDQLASVHGRVGHAMQIDTRSITVEQIPFDLAAQGLSLLVIDSRAPHALVDGEYAERPTSCREAALMLGVPALRDVPLDGLDETLGRMRSELLRRRARHVITDSARVIEVGEILQDGGDPRRIGKLLNDSHASMRDDFEITVPPVDVLQAAVVEAGAHGARMTGGGFGGCVIALVETGTEDDVIKGAQRAAADHGFAEPAGFVAQAADGARRLTG
ncbi:galactokinase [Luteipulveratus mongoliensis]|uniref:Galactokinase n=1 Tax=Luteipulveratus mongoliensis TaxID=571913 RepID=A0A0K1JNX1_9MICO|nr:galactokinase [Luteipulveratus mongoliensis]AKU18419.1 galactokinase [Luteipulveratus mongoliensis]